jgi:hypothetical protein
MPSSLRAMASEEVYSFFFFSLLIFHPIVGCALHSADQYRSRVEVDRASSAAFYAVCFDEHAPGGLPSILNLTARMSSVETAHPRPKKGRQGHPPELRLS